MSMNVDEEWENFISNDYDNVSEDDEIDNVSENLNIYNKDLISINLSETPKATNIYISTKTKIAYLNMPIDLKTLFWAIPVISYANPSDGVIKKQMKFNSTMQDELTIIKNNLLNVPYYEENIITHIDNPSGRIKFKDIRKVSIGISKKDIMSYRTKKKSAFYNCFVIILRTKIENSFKEFHVKVFNTGKLEIPGIQSETTYEMILKQVVDTLQPHISDKLGYKDNTNETVLINSNFNCGFFINREVLYDILKYKYNLQSIYDPCSYPGIQCKFYYNPEIDIQNGCQISKENRHLYKDIKEVSFMVFRTGSVLIVGKCDESALFSIYEFLKNILTNEYKSICQKNIETSENNLLKDKKKKIRRKNIMIETSI